MGDIKNKRIVIDDIAYRYSAITGGHGLGLTFALEGVKRSSVGRRLVSGVRHDADLKPALLRTIVRRARGEGWDPRIAVPRPFFVSPTDPLFEPSPPPRVMVGDELRHLEAIRAQPDDSSLRFVYADWLLERGDAYGELVVLSCTAEERALSLVELARFGELLAMNGRAWLGPLADMTWRRQWERGFMVEAELRARYAFFDAMRDPRWAFVRRLDARATGELAAGAVHVLTGAAFDRRELLHVNQAQLGPLFAASEDDRWFPRELHVYTRGQTRDDDAVARLAASRRIHRLFVDETRVERSW